MQIEDIEKYLMDLAMERKIVMKKNEESVRIYPAKYYYMELNTAKMLHDLDIDYEEDDDMILRRLEKLEEYGELRLDEKQREAVKEAVKSGVFVLTGGPGTGKTTTINAMIRYFESEGMDIRLAAPTGRAAKRMTEATGYEAQTIHRLLEVSGNPEEGKTGGFGRNRENPLETDAVIIDEMSMVDLPLMHALLSAIVPGTRLILVGDINQLPSVGPGKVLKDIIDSKVFRVVMLTKIFRQAQESDIVMNAHKINAGQEVVLDNKSKDFFPETTGCQCNYQRRPDIDPEKTAQICGCTYVRYPGAYSDEKGLLGVERLNKILQQYLNPPSDKKAEKEYGEKLFRVGDKVMQVKNNYQLEWEIATKYGLVVDKGIGVFNGDMGIITKINTYDETLEVEYDEKGR